MESAKRAVSWGVGTAIGIASAGLVLRSMEAIIPRKRKKKLYMWGF